MIIGVVGAGAIGGYCGAVLSRAGHDVIFAARGKHLEAMKERGLLVHNDAGTFRVDGHFTADLKEMSRAELILFTVSSTDTLVAGRELLPWLKKDAGILTLQNGVDNEEILAGLFGKNRVLSGVAYLTVILEAPGVLRQKKLQSLLIGALDESGRIRAESACRMFQAAGMECELSEQIMVEKWSKLLINSVFNPIAAFNRVTVGEILDDENLRATAERSLTEAVQIGSALGIPVKQELIDGFFEEAESARKHRPSMLQHREQGKQMEVESLCGYFVRKGQALGIDTPSFSTLYEALSKINAENRKKG
ncbi:2-dehydropantoate 2-reductase [Paenibacillus sp. N4]|uniref:ketopantoate reductase family protein n=1 Tax=Paenibacillus vietnamensis TaxID=2590547 RepID=UPI001CD0E89D|nr:2-dehydropantoate 2-reductase [Paenibacillus vietnamensis]MCA0757918.1 2-dehydropantoate 2-reductase [Paenibacillus vietnamensis]